MKVVINDTYGGFGISKKAAEWLIEEKDWQVTQWEDGTFADDSADLVDRTAGPGGDPEDRLLGPRYSFVTDRQDAELRKDPDLIECIETLGEEANGRHSKLKVIEVPDDVEWEIKEYDGNEWVAEKHRTWT